MRCSRCNAKSKTGYHHIEPVLDSELSIVSSKAQLCDTCLRAISTDQELGAVFVQKVGKGEISQSEVNP